MKQLFIKYNPYKLETEITVDGEKPAQNSLLSERAMPGTRLQEWVEELPQILLDEYNVNEFDITFHGTQLDYEDLEEAFEASGMSVKLNHIPAKETTDKEALISEVFKEIQKKGNNDGHFKDLCTPDVVKAFEQAKNNEFEVVVVAKISAGKSTLINSMLGKQLMPSRAEACTAIITQIKDTGEENWQAQVFDKNGNRTKIIEKVRYKDMDDLNIDEDVSIIRMTGNIPFVLSKEMSLVLVDTPGPGSARNPEHEKKQWDYVSQSSKALVVYVTDSTYETEYDQNILKKIAGSMSVGGKQSKDRFIFVVNKMDDRRTTDPNDTKNFLSGIRLALKEEHGIENPNMFPVVALPALNIRTIQNGDEIDAMSRDETENKVKWLNKYENMHYDEYATLPLSARKDIEKRLAEAQNEYEEALIHTGIPSVEAAIRQYVEKYAKTAKIKNIVDTFMHKLEEKSYMEETKKNLAQNMKEADKFVREINLIEKEIEEGKSVKTFEAAVRAASKEINEKSLEAIENIRIKYQSRLTKKYEYHYNNELTVREAELELNNMYAFAQRLIPQYNSEMDAIIKENLVERCSSLLSEYRKKLDSLSGSLRNSGAENIKIEPLKLMKADIIDPDDFDFNDLIQTVEEIVDREWIKNTDKKWYKPWTWFQEDGHYKDIIEEHDVIKYKELAEKYLTPINKELSDRGKDAIQYVEVQSKHIEEYFRKIFKDLDEKLKEKLEELRETVVNKEQAEKSVAECQKNLDWLEKIIAKVNSILEI